MDLSQHVVMVLLKNKYHVVTQKDQEGRARPPITSLVHLTSLSFVEEALVMPRSTFNEIGKEIKEVDDAIRFLEEGLIACGMFDGRFPRVKAVNARKSRDAVNKKLLREMAMQSPGQKSDEYIECASAFLAEGGTLERVIELLAVEYEDMERYKALFQLLNQRESITDEEINELISKYPQLKNQYERASMLESNGVLPSKSRALLDIMLESMPVELVNEPTVIMMLNSGVSAPDILYAANMKDRDLVRYAFNRFMGKTHDESQADRKRLVKSDLVRYKTFLVYLSAPSVTFSRIRDVEALDGAEAGYYVACLRAGVVHQDFLDYVVPNKISTWQAKNFAMGRNAGIEPLKILELMKKPQDHYLYYIAAYAESGDHVIAGRDLMQARLKGVAAYSNLRKCGFQVDDLYTLLWTQYTQSYYGIAALESMAGSEPITPNEVRELMIVLEGAGITLGADNKPVGFVTSYFTLYSRAKKYAAAEGGAGHAEIVEAFKEFFAASGNGSLPKLNGYSQNLTDNEMAQWYFLSRYGSGKILDHAKTLALMSSYAQSPSGRNLYGIYQLEREITKYRLQNGI